MKDYTTKLEWPAPLASVSHFHTVQLVTRVKSVNFCIGEILVVNHAIDMWKQNNQREIKIACSLLNQIVNYLKKGL